MKSGLFSATPLLCRFPAVPSWRLHAVLVGLWLLAPFAAEAQDARGYRGEWNSWGYTAMTLEGNTWRATVQANATGSRNFKIAHDNWNYQWTSGGAVSLNTLTTFNTGGADSSINGTNGRSYTFTMNNVNAGNNGTVVVQETANAPVTISSVSHDAAGTVGSVTVRITTSATPSSGERIFVRWTKDNWASSSFVEASGSGTSWTAAVAHGSADAGATVQFYVLTTTFTSPTHANTDLQTLRLANNSGSNWSYNVGPEGRTTGATPTTAFLGDNNIQMNVESWQQLNSVNRSFATVFMRHNNANLTTGTTQGSGRNPGASSDGFYAESAQFTATGTWYWAMRISYGSGNDFWLMDDSTWHRIYSMPPVQSRLTVTVSALNNPSGQTATKDGANPSSQINLAWTKNAQNHDVMIVRKTAAQSWTEPTQGTPYSVNDNLGDGVVIYKGSGTSFDNSGLTGDTTYDFKFYSINNDYYSAGVTAQATTDPACVLPTIYNVTGGGAYCSGGAGVSVGLSNSESGVTYQLYRDGGTTAVGAPVSGTGSAISFGNQTVADSYTVVATRTLGGCTENMSGNATVTADPVSVGGTATAASATACSGTGTTVTLSGHTGNIQWQQSNDGIGGWANVSGGSGATSATYTTPNLTTDIYYRAEVISGTCAPAYSSVAGISVSSSAAITAQPDDETVCEDDAATFTVTATGDSVAYQWRRRGTGWGSGNGWTINNGNGGVFIGSSDINTGGNAWGMFNNGATATEAIRNFGALSVGDVFEIDMDNGDIQSGGTVGISLRNSSNQNMVELYFVGGTTFYRINRSGGPVDTGLSFTSSGLRFTLTKTSTTAFSAVIEAGATTYGPYTGNFISSGSVSQVRLFSVNNGSGGNFDAFFNSIKVGPTAAAPFYDDDASGYSTWSGNQGNAPLANGGAFSGATTAMLTIDPATGAEEGDYDVVVYNVCAAVLSDAVTLTVAEGVSITTTSPLPQGETGLAYTQSISATGGSGFTFGVETGALPPGVTLSSGGVLDGTPTTADTFSFTIGVTNSVGCTDSRAFALTILSGAPATPASDLVVTAAGVDTISLSWTRGDGENVLIVAREGAAPETPADATSYTANTAWGSAGAVGSDSKAVYLGTGTSVVLTGLGEATRYHFAAYEFNGSGGTEAYRTAGAPAADGFTLSTEPANHATGFTASNPTATTIDLAWTAAAGSPAPDGYLILRRVNAAPTALPAQGQGYNVGQTVGDAIVAAIVTSGTSVTATGLSPQNTHYFALYPFRWNGTDGETRRYKTDGTVPTSFETTLAGEIIVDPFEGYSGDLNGENGGTGWTNAWAITRTDGNVTIQDNSRPIPDGYPDADGDHVRAGQFDGLTNPNFTARRGFEAFSTGRIYASAVFRYDWNNPSVYLGMSFLDGTSERAFAGRPFQNSELLGLDSFGGGQFMSTQPFFGGNDYVLIMTYDFDTRTFKALIFNSLGDPLPESEPGAWHAERILDPGRIAKVDGIQIAGGNNFGYAYFDEVRISDTWAGLLQIDTSDPNEPPSIQTSQIQFDFERKDRLALTSWQRGNGAKVLLVAREGTPVNADPVNGVVYTANATFGTGSEIGTGNFVIFNGDNSVGSMTLLGLSPDTVYHVRAYEYNEADGTKYLTTQVPGNPASYQTLAPPTAISAGLAGTTATDLTWQKFNHRNVLIAYRVNTPVTFVPDEGTAYSNGQNVGDGHFVLRGSEAETFYNHSGLTAGQTMHYRFFSVQDVYYSEGLAASITLAESEIIYDGFANSSGNLHNTGGGTGWADNWSVVNNTDADYTATSLPADSYAWGSGNKAVFYGDVNGREIDATRMFDTCFTTGKVVISWLQEHANSGPQNYAGVRLLDDNGDEVAFIGKYFDDYLRIAESSANGVNTLSPLASGTGAIYIYTVMYDFETRVLSANAYRHSARLTWAEPPVFDVMTTQTVGHIESLCGIRLSVGANPGHQIGFVYFDEIRAGDNWTEVVRRDGQRFRQMMESGPNAELIFIGADYDPTNAPIKNFITDAELADDSNLIDIAVRFSSPFGIFITNNPASANTIFADFGNFSPNWDPLSQTVEGENALGFDEIFDTFVGISGSTVVTGYHFNAFTGTNFGDWDVNDEFFITVSAQTFPPAGGTAPSPLGGQPVPDRRAMTVNFPLQFFIIDDDTNAPLMRGFNVDAPTLLTDADLRQGNFVLEGEISDPGSGVDTNELWFTLRNPDGWEVFAEQPFATRPNQASARTSFEPLAHPVGVIPYLDNRIGIWTALVYAADADNDRPNDASSTTRVFQVHVVDDDTFGPTMPGTVVYDPFTDGDAVNTTGGDPLDIPWYTQSSSPARAVVPDPWGIGNGNALRITPSNGGCIVGPVGADLTIEEQMDAVSFSFQMRFGANAASVNDSAGFRFGIYDHRALPVGGDGDDNSEDDFGYYVAFATGNARPGAVLGKEEGVIEPILGGGDTNTLAAAPTFSLDPDTVHHIELRAYRTEDGVRLLLAVDGVEILTAEDTTDIYTNFNSLAFCVSDTLEVYLDDIAFAQNAVEVDVAGWTNTTTFELSWDIGGVVDESDLYEFRVTANGDRPTNAADGESVGLTDNIAIEIPQQGRLTNYVFAVDNDNDRPDDREAGMPGWFVTMVDTTPPTQVVDLLVDDTDVADPQSMLQADWAEVTDFGGEGLDPLSPFMEYRVYYWVTNAAGDGLTNFQALVTAPEDTSMVVTNLAPGVEYDFAVAAQDRAGNLGPLSDPVRFGTQPFFITNAVAISPREVRFTIRTAPGGAYDLLRADAVDYGDQLTNLWILAREFEGTSASEFTVTNDLFTVPQARENVRFYRAAPRRRWARTLPLRSASKEIYAVKQAPLHPGQNWVAFPAVPDSNRVDLVLGTYLPASVSLFGATRVTWYERTLNQTATNQIWLVNDNPPRWTSNGADNLNHIPVPLHDGFIITLPSHASPTNLLLVGRVPLTNQTQTLPGGNVYSLISARTPQSLHPSNLFTVADGNAGSGNFTGGLAPIPNPFYGSDILWKFDRQQQRVANIIYFNTSQNAWLMDTGQPVPDDYFKPDDAIVFLSGRSSVPIILTNAAAAVGEGPTAPRKWSEPTISITP